jgi:hypothetical protein
MILATVPPGVLEEEDDTVYISRETGLRTGLGIKRGHGQLRL